MEQTDQAQARQMRLAKWGLIVCNVVLIAAALLAAVFYSLRLERNQNRVEIDSFCTTVEAMKQVASSYFSQEMGYATNWAGYIQAQDMDADQALDYLAKSNRQSDRYIHIVDMEDYSAWAADGTITECYQQFLNSEDPTYQIFAQTMERMFSGRESEIAVLGRYSVPETRVSVISVGTKVWLREANGQHKAYLLLRLIPVDSIRKIWVFPTEYADAEVGIITSSGAYVLPGPSMRSNSLLDYFRAYNFPDNYRGMEEIEQRLLTTQSGLMEYKDALGRPCYWYYARFDNNDALDILGRIPVETLHGQSRNNMGVAVIIGSALLVLMLLDGAYILRINRKLRLSAKQALQASQAKTQFLSSMSHDIRTPMNAVLGMTELAQRHADDPEYVRACLKKVNVAGNHLLTLINDVLDISKVESGRAVLNAEPFRVDALIDNLKSIVAPQAEDQGLRFETQVALSSDKPLLGDPLRLNQVLLNLLTNAVKYNKPGGWVRLECREKPTMAGFVCLIFTVSDNGIGMTQEFQKTMYDSFSRAVDTRIDRIQGTGLGLAIVKQMVELMGGTIQCVSEPGQGTVFTVQLSLPEAQADPGAGSSVDPENETFDGLRVLVAEDNDLNWEIVSAMLEEKHILCDRAENGQVCLDMLTAAPAGTYGLIFMDVQMPVMGGREAARAIRASRNPDIRDIPIAAMTADAFAEDIQSCRQAGMDAHIAKPIRMETVCKVIRELWKPR